MRKEATEVLDYFWNYIEWNPETQASVYKVAKAKLQALSDALCKVEASRPLDNLVVKTDDGFTIPSAGWVVLPIDKYNELLNAKICPSVRPPSDP